jgi:shikimate dehydrogenase
MVRGTTKLYMIVGHPISQVKSPEIFNEGFARNNIDAVMIPLDIDADGLSAFVDMFRHSHNIHGVIVTIPYKERIVQYIDRPSAQVSALGAANVIRLTRSREIEGDMMDGKGFLRALSKKNVSVQNKHVLIIGCGGAGSAVAWDVLHDGVARVSLLDVDYDKARDLHVRLVEDYPHRDIRVVSNPPASFDLVMNATPLGMASTDPMPMDVENIPAGAVVTDAVTSPPMTPFLESAMMKGLVVQSGPEMAAGQAPLIAAFFGIET